jgi:PAS domain S-box-containing protein
MSYLKKTKKQLVSELEELHRRNAELEELSGNDSGCTNELRSSEARYRKLIETANDAIFVADAETGVIIDANHKAEFLMGMPVKDIIGMHQSQLHPEEEAERYSAIFKKHIEEGTTTTDTLFIINKSGNKVPVEISASITDFQGKKIVQGIFRDITDRLKAEEELMIKTRAIESSINPIGLVDMEAKIKYINDAAVKLWGYKNSKEMIGRPLTDFWLGDRVYLTLTNLKEKGHDSGEDIGRRKDGSLFNVLFSANVLKDVSGRPVAILGSFVDITERKKDEESLLIFKNLINQSNDAIFVIDPETSKFLTVNDKACSNLGYSRDELLKMGVIDIEAILPDNFSWAEHIEEVRKSGFMILEGLHKRKDGTVYPAEINTKLVDISEKQYMVAVARDITERKKIEEALKTSEEKYRLIFEYYPLGILHYDKNGITTACNQNFADIIGAPIKKLVNFDMMRQVKDRKMKAAIAASLRGKIGRFEGIYQSVMAGKQTSIKAEFATIRDTSGSVIGGIGVFEDISVRVKNEEALVDSENRVRMKAKELQESNTALKVLLKQRENDKDESEGNILANVKHLIMPYIEKLKKNRSITEDLVNLNILESNLQEIISPFAQKLSSNNSGLTPKEIQVANLTRDGKQDKEISGILNISIDTVKFHRKNIRKKLGLYGQRTNLRTYLLSEFNILVYDTFIK